MISIFCTFLILKVCQFFVSSFLSFGKRYKKKLESIFDQWPKLYYLGLNVEPKIKNLKVI